MKNSSSINSQRGSGIIEALVAVLLVGLLSQGTLYLTSRASNAQAASRLQEIAVSQLRGDLMTSKDICSNPPSVTLPNGQVVTAEVQGCNTTINAVINSVTVAVPAPLRLSLTSDAIGGTLVVGGTWNQ